ncbi:MAG: hypothetical protein LBQ44_07125, partial [Treponema sp.]|nr:hypothetical protein [Treponema sp.]
FAAVFQAAAQGLPRLAVAEFSINDLRNQKLAGDAVTVRNLVESNMINTGKYRMITREEIDKLLREQSIQLSSIASLENLRKLRLQNISYLVTGSVDANGSDYVVTLRIPDVAAGRFYHSDYALMGGGSRDLLNGVTALVRSFIAGLSAGGERAAQQLGGGGRGEYKVGDFGPAGGLIFYDKGVFSDGWRYLEAAPVETEFRAQWGASGKTIDGTQANVGSGKRNTRIIVDKLNEWGESGRAAQLCGSLVSDGFSDWFLPGKDELDLMYKNLAKKGLGNFSSDDYWSSSEYSSGSAWDQRFSDGPQSGLNKTYTDSVRAVRAF